MIIHLVAYTKNPESSLIPPFPLISISNPSASCSRLTSNIYLKSVHFSPWSCSSSCYYLLPGLVQNLWTHLPALPLAPPPHNSFFMHPWKWTLKSINQIRSFLSLNAAIWFPIILRMKSKCLEWPLRPFMIWPLTTSHLNLVVTTPSSITSSTEDLLLVCGHMTLSLRGAFVSTDPWIWIVCSSLTSFSMRCSLLMP